MKHHHNSFMESRTQILGKKTALKHVKNTRPTPFPISIFPCGTSSPEWCRSSGHQVLFLVGWNGHHKHKQAFCLIKQLFFVAQTLIQNTKKIPGNPLAQHVDGKIPMVKQTQNVYVSLTMFFFGKNPMIPMA